MRLSVRPESHASATSPYTILISYIYGLTVRRSIQLTLTNCLNLGSLAKKDRAQLRQRIRTTSLCMKMD